MKTKTKQNSEHCTKTTLSTCTVAIWRKQKYSACRDGSLVNDIASQVLKAIELSLLQLHKQLAVYAGGTLVFAVALGNRGFLSPSRYTQPNTSDIAKGYCRVPSKEKSKSIEVQAGFSSCNVIAFP